MLLVVIFLVGELIVCLSLFLGFFSRLAGLTVAGIMTLKIVILAQHSPFQTSYELPMMIWAMGLAILCLGGGALSTDRAISENLLPVIG